MSNNSINNSRLAKNTVFLYIRMAVVLIISLYTSRVVLEILGVEDFGIYNIVAGFVSLFGFINSSLSACIQRFYNYESGRVGIRGVQNVYRISLLIELILSVFVLILIESIGLYFINHKLNIPEGRYLAANILFQLATIQLVLSMIQAPYMGIVLAREKMDFYALVSIFDVVLKLIGVYLISFQNQDYLIVYGALMTIITALNFIAYFIFSKLKFKELKFVQNSDDNKIIFKSMFSFTGWNVFGALAMIARNQGLNVILNIFFGPLLNAARGVATQVQGAIMGFVTNISMAARPQIVESYAQENYKRSFELMYGISKISYYLCLIIALPVILNIDFLLHLWLGDNVPQYTNSFVALIITASMIDLFNQPLTILVMASGKVGKYCLLTSLTGVLVLPLAYIFMKFDMPPDYIFISGIIISTLVQIVALYVAKQVTGLKIIEYIKYVILPILVVSTVVFLLVLLFKSFICPDISNVIINSLIIILGVALVSYFVGMNSQERGIIKLFFKRN